jgi:hypothetical protein
MDADAQLEGARAAGAEKNATYEWTLAQMYLHKAKEQVGRSQYETAINYAQQSLKYSAAAKQRALSGSSTVPTGPLPMVVPLNDEPAPPK